MLDFRSIILPLSLILLGLVFTGAASIRAEDQPVDMNHARELLDKKRNGEKLTPEDENYLKRAREQLQKSRSGDNSNSGDQTKKPVTDTGTGDKFKGGDGGLSGEAKNEPPKEHEAIGSAANAVSEYKAISDRTTHPKPPLPKMGAAGTSIVDPTFGCRILRVTDGNLYPSYPGSSYMTPAGTNQNPFNADSSKFYVEGEK
jgi:hypothetical protein